MAAPVPTAGWPSRTAAVAGLRRRGLSPNAIAEQLGIGRSTVYALMRDIERSAGVDTVHIRADLGRQMLDEARRRGLSVGALAEKIITTVVTDGLIAAVLDDEETNQSERDLDQVLESCAGALDDLPAGIRRAIARPTPDDAPTRPPEGRRQRTYY